MPLSTASKSDAVRAKLDYPVIDGDGHWLEPIPIFLDFLKDVAGAQIAEQYLQSKAVKAQWYRMSDEERLSRR